MTRFLVRLGSAPFPGVRSLDSCLESLIRAADWSAFADIGGGGVRVRATSHTPAVREDVLARTVGGLLRRRAGGGSGVDSDETPGVGVYVRCADDAVTLSIDASGEPLHKRGYRADVGPASLRETHAAALVQWSGWTTELPFVDPFCGSGTVVIEAARSVAPDLPVGREFAFQRWPMFADSATGERAREASPPLQSPPELTVWGLDKHAPSVECASAHAERAQVGSCVRFAVADAAQPSEELARLGRRGHVVTNPPYGKRLGDKESVRRLFRAWGDVLRRQHRGWTLTLLCPDSRLVEHLRLELREVAAIRLGGLRVGVWHGRIA